MNRDKIALQLYSVRRELEQDFYGTLKAVKEIGYAGVEFAGLYGHDPLEIKTFCEGLGLVPISAHVPFQEMMADLDGTIAMYKAVGVPYVVIPYLTEDLRPGQPGFQSVIDGMKVIGQKLKENGMVQQYHNHDFEFVKLEGQYALDVLYEEIPADLLQTQLDTCWVKVGGEDPAAYVAKYAGRCPTVHLKDYAGSKTENMYGLIGLEGTETKADGTVFQLRPLGEGCQDFAAIVAAGDAGGAQWYIVEQDEPSMGLSPMECAKVSYEYLIREIIK